MMILIEDVGIDKEILTEKFACDISKCKGACCTFEGDYGAPVLEEEVFIINEYFSIIKEYVPEKSLEIIQKQGFVEGAPGDYTTVCIDRRDCVFVFYDDGVAKCAIQQAYHDGKIDFAKPISCHLFPVRVGDFDGLYIYYEKIRECKEARERGLKENIQLVDYLEEPLIKAFGEEWYEKLKNYLEENKAK